LKEFSSIADHVRRSLVVMSWHHPPLQSALRTSKYSASHVSF
jgi:hypothetical protein